MVVHPTSARPVEPRPWHGAAYVRGFVAGIAVAAGVVSCLSLYRTVASINYVRDAAYLARYRAVIAKDTPEALPPDATLTGYYQDVPYCVVVRETPGAREKWTDAFRAAEWRVTSTADGWSAAKGERRALMLSRRDGRRCVLGFSLDRAPAQPPILLDEAKKAWLGD